MVDGLSCWFGLWLLGKTHIPLTKNQTNCHDLKPQT